MEGTKCFFGRSPIFKVENTNESALSQLFLLVFRQSWWTILLGATSLITTTTYWDRSVPLVNVGCHIIRNIRVVCQSYKGDHEPSYSRKQATTPRIRSMENWFKPWFPFKKPHDPMTHHSFSFGIPLILLRVRLSWASFCRKNPG